MKLLLHGQTLAVKPTQNISQLLLKLNVLISKSTRSHRNFQALQLFDQIHSSHYLRPDHYSLASTLTACANLCNVAAGKQLHSYTIRAGFKIYTHIYNTLLSFYVNVSELDSVCRVFDEVQHPDVYSWTTLLSGYAKFGYIDLACQLFDQIPNRNVALWNAVITGCVKHGHQEIALKMFCEMHRQGVRQDHFSFASVLSLCCSLEQLDFGEQVHSLVIRTGSSSQRVSVVNSLVTMYFNCGMIGDAYGLFDEAIIRDQITFNAAIGGLVKRSRNLEALMMFKEMQEDCFAPTELTFVSVLSACSSAKMGELGTQIHAQSVKFGFEASVLVSNSTITMYASTGDLINARLVFEMIQEKDLVSWNSMITCYAQGNCYELAMSVYLQMQRERVKPDEFTIGSLLTCCECIETTMMIQALVTKSGVILNIEVGNALISAFSKHGKVKGAQEIFDEMSSKNLITWNSLISGYVLNDFPLMGLELFSKLQNSGLKPGIFTLSLVLSTCANSLALRHGKQIHAYILRSGLDVDISMGNVFITLYAKCGMLGWSAKVFYGMEQRDAITWNSIIAACAQHGEGKEAIHFFESMRDSGVEPDEVTFSIILSACSHAGLIDQGRYFFSSMVQDHGLHPRIDHYSCIIDLLGRAGHLDEAERLISDMPFRPDSHIWWALLSACKAHNNVRLGRIAAGFLLESEPEHPAVYVVLSNIYAAAGQWDEAANVRELMRKNGVMKQPGCSWMELQDCR